MFPLVPAPPPDLPPLPSLTVQIITIALVTLQRTLHHDRIQTTRPIAHSYDYVMVGSGTAGAVLAGRLSEDPRVRVLVLEAGGPQTVTNDAPGQAFNQALTESDWNYTTSSQYPNAGRAFGGFVRLVRGHIVGGSHNMNFMVYSRGNPRDYDSWVEKFGATGWSYREVLPYFLRSENQTDEMILRENPGYHSTSGPVVVRTPKNPDPIITIFKDGLEHYGVRRVDQNGPSQLGIGFMQQTIFENGTRSTTASAFLEANMDRPNLQVLTRAFVTRILFNTTRDSDGRITATGVEFEHGNRTWQVFASRQVLICAGSINTPRLLMLSGIGPADHLAQFGIEALVDLRVGYNFKDHVLSMLDFDVFNQSLITSGDQWTVENMYRWYLDSAGPLSQLPLVFMYYNSKYNNETDWPDLQTDFIVRPLSDNLEQQVAAYDPRVRDQWREYYRPFIPDRSRHRMLALAFHYRPHSVGRMYLNSTDPHDSLVLDSRYLTEQYDIDSMIEAISTTLKITSGPPFNKYVRPYPHPIPGCQLCSSGEIWDCREYLECYARTITYSVGHQVGTCKMGSTEDSVVDPRLRVRGVNHLRVIDGSIYPDITNGNTNAPIMMFGEYAADLIRQDDGLIFKN